MIELNSASGEDELPSRGFVFIHVLSSYVHSFQSILLVHVVHEQNNVACRYV
jgi:hypothetical protein